MKKHFSLLIIAIVSAILSLAFANLFIYALEGAGGGSKVTIVATVSPVRIIVVDRSLTIQKIVSNTKEDVRPQVYLNTEDGEEVGYTGSILKQYMDLKKIISFNRPGVLYVREERPVQAIIKNGFGFFGKLMSF